MSNQTNSGQVLLIMTGFVCNNNCLMCSVKPKGTNNKPRNTEDVIADIERGRKLHYDRVEFTGGEPTVRKDLPQLLAKAQELGFSEIAISTNCRTFSHLEFLKSLQKLGLNRVTTTIYGYDSKSHDTITRAPGSFIQSIQGIKNLLSLGITTSVNTVIFNETAKNLKKTGDFLASIGVEYWTLLDLIPDGYAQEEYSNLSLSPKQITSMFEKIEPVIAKFNLLLIMDFPYCLLPPKIISNPVVELINTEGRTEIIKQVGYKPNRFKENNNIFVDFHKIRSKKCRTCAYYDGCGGSWITYFKRYNDAFIKPFPQKI